VFAAVLVGIPHLQWLSAWRAPVGGVVSRRTFGDGRCAAEVVGSAAFVRSVRWPLGPLSGRVSPV